MICPKCKKDAPAEARYCPWCGRLLGAVQRSSTRRGNKQGTAYKRNGSWTAKWTIHSFTDNEGKYHQICKTKAGFSKKADALAYCLDQLKVLTEEKPIPQLVTIWNQYKENRLTELSKDKQTNYAIAWKRWEPLWYYQVNRITSAQMQEVVDHATSTYYPAKDMRTVMINLYKIIGAEGFASKDVPEFIKLPALEETEQIPFSETEQASLWKVWENGCIEAGIPLTLIYTGLMPAELMGLKEDMIDLEHRQIIGAGHKTKVRRKATVYLPDAIIPVLEEMIATAPQRRLKQPFPRSEQKFYKDYYKALEVAKTRRLTPYSCRHTTATALAVTEGIAPQTVKKIMRWSTTRMLDRYAHPDDKDARQAVNMIKTGNAPAIHSEPEVVSE